MVYLNVQQSSTTNNCLATLQREKHKAEEVAREIWSFGEFAKAPWEVVPDCPALSETVSKDAILPLQALLLGNLPNKKEGERRGSWGVSTFT